MRHIGTQELQSERLILRRFTMEDARICIRIGLVMKR